MDGTAYYYQSLEDELKPHYGQAFFSIEPAYIIEANL